MNAYYDEFDYQQYWVGREYEDRAEKIAIKKFFEKIPQKESLIDIGAGFGRLTSAYSPLFKKCFLVDPSEDLLGQAKLNFKGLKNLTFKVGEAEKLPVDSESFDVALMVRVIHHLEDPTKALAEVYRVLKPGGFLILEFANKIHFRARIRALLKGNFSFASDFSPQEQRTPISINTGKIAFLNHHLEKIKQDLKKAGFKILEVLSVSNFRLPLIKKLIPSPLLLFLESLLQKPLARVSFGPSLFILAQKPGVSFSNS